MSLVALRAAALAAALVLALLSRGDVIVLAGLLAFAAWRPLPALAAVSALAATAWRWSSTALEDIAGAQAVLGPAGLVDPPTAAAAAWLGAAAVVLATPDLLGPRTGERAGPEVGQAGEDVEVGALGGPRWQVLALRWLPPLAFGATAAVVVAGPAWGTDPWVRLGASTAAAGAAFLRWGPRRRHRLRRWVDDRRLPLDAVAAVAGVAALVLVGIDSPPAKDLLDVEALVEGVVVAVAVALLTVAAAAALQLRSDPAP